MGFWHFLVPILGWELVGFELRVMYKVTKNDKLYGSSDIFS
jgi:hypothetical protein